MGCAHCMAKRERGQVELERQLDSERTQSPNASLGPRDFPFWVEMSADSLLLRGLLVKRRVDISSGNPLPLVKVHTHSAII